MLPALAVSLWISKLRKGGTVAIAVDAWPSKNDLGRLAATGSAELAAEGSFWTLTAV